MRPSQKFKRLLDIFFAEECLHCRATGQILCEKCLTSIPREKMRKITETEKSLTINLEAFPWVHSTLLYRNQILQKSIYYLKYHHTQSMAKYLAKIVWLDFLLFLEKILAENHKTFADLIILPIPISRRRALERDYNQSEVLVREILKLVSKSRELELAQNLKTDLLVRIKHTQKFAHTHSQETRQELIRNAFALNKNLAPNNFPEQIFILFDDVTTTGSTFYEARKTLIASGAKRETIFAYALAH